MLTVSETAERLGAVIQELRSKAGLTQAELGEAVGEAQAWVSRRENATTEPTPSEIERIEQALGVQPGEIYERAGVSGPNHSARKAILDDPLLSREARAIVLSAYDAAVRRVGRVGRRKRSNGDVATN